MNTNTTREETRNVASYLEQAVRRGASDLMLAAGNPVSMKAKGQTCGLETEPLSANGAKQIVTELYQLAGRSMDDYLENWDDDFAFDIPGLARFRVNTYFQKGAMAAVVRVVQGAPDWQALNIPRQVMELANAESGLILIAGTAGSGKSTTMACLVDWINNSRENHIVTLEDPIEYVHTSARSFVSQREIGVDVKSYPAALKAAMRQSPDVILIGEIRDQDTAQAAMNAAESGHLVIAAIHTRGAANAADRFVDFFPSDQQGQVRVQLSTVLSAVVYQRLLPDVRGQMIPAFEIMKVDPAIAVLIRENKCQQINNNICCGREEGMISMDRCILDLFLDRRITKDVAVKYAADPEKMGRLAEKNRETEYKAAAVQERRELFGKLKFAQKPAMRFAAG